MEEISQNKAEILGLLCSEGSNIITTSKYWEYNSIRKKKYFKNRTKNYVQFANYNPKLLDYFRELVEIEYNYKASKSWDRIRICKKTVTKEIIKYTNLGHLKWDVPECIMKGESYVKARFIKGFFEGDGTMSRQIIIYSTNKKGLEKISLILNDLKIKSTLNETKLRPKRKPFYYIYIREQSRDRFLEVINPKFKVQKPL